MKLLRLVPLFMLLITAISLSSPAYAAVNYNASKSNTGNLTCSAPSGQSFTATYAITFTSTLNGGKALNSNPLVDTCTFSGGSTPIKNSPKLLKTTLPADGYIVNTQITQGNVINTCKNNVTGTQPNAPTTIECKANSGAVVMVTVTTNVPESPSLQAVSGGNSE
jgi:hypothetical protein